MTTTIAKRVENGVARLVLRRAEVRNAFNPTMIAEATAALVEFAARSDVRALVLDGEGPVFSAGADLGWMKEAGAYSESEARADAERLSRLFRSLDEAPFPTFVVARGAALGGGAGLLAAADVVVAEEGTKIGFTEVRLGILPAVISPYAVRAIGVRNARRYFSTGEIFDAARAREIGLVSETVAVGLAAARVEEIVRGVLSVAPLASRAAKKLANDVASKRPEDVADSCAALIAKVRRGEEAQEGLAAFLEKRTPRFAAGGS
jgi:methylglutaconyl-CoA hydratase